LNQHLKPYDSFLIQLYKVAFLIFLALSVLPYMHSDSTLPNVYTETLQLGKLIIHVAVKPSMDIWCVDYFM